MEKEKHAAMETDHIAEECEKKELGDERLGEVSGGSIEEIMREIERVLESDSSKSYYEITIPGQVVPRKKGE